MKHTVFEKAKKNFGFGCMRLPMKDGEVDHEAFCEMVDAFLGAGFNYFDTAHGYIGGKSETAIKAALTSRYPRESYVLTNKLSTFHFEKQEEIRPLFEQQLKACGVDYFDLYLMHAQNKELFEKYKKCRAYETALEFLREGKIKHFGISFHDKAEILEEILTAYPQIEAVQIQFNYVDYEDAAVDSRRVYEVCRKFGKPIIVMEPVKGGNLVKLPALAQEIFNALKGGSAASYAIRYAAGFDGVAMVLSGMGNMEMMQDNLSYMQSFSPLSEKEHEAVRRVCKILRSQDTVPCTACAYCTEVCPQKIPIPHFFSCLNSKRVFKDWSADFYYDIHKSHGGAADSCISCGQCENICPQRLPIRKLLKEVTEEFEKKK